MVVKKAAIIATLEPVTTNAVEVTTKKIIRDIRFARVTTVGSMPSARGMIMAKAVAIRLGLEKIPEGRNTSGVSSANLP